MLTKQTIFYLRKHLKSYILKLSQCACVILILSFYCRIVLFKAKNDFFIKHLPVFIAFIGRLFEVYPFQKVFINYFVYI